MSEHEPRGDTPFAAALRARACETRAAYYLGLARLVRRRLLGGGTMTTRDPTIRPFPELEQVERAALTYAWSMLYLGIGVGFVLAWLMCSLRACDRPREPATPVPAAATSSDRRSAERSPITR